MHIDRRNLLQAASLALPGLAAERSGEAVPSRGYFDKGVRLTISMWDTSWLTAHHTGGAFEDLDRCVAQARERGYNALRVDCFPSRLFEPESRFEKNFDPAIHVKKWGQTDTAFSCNVRKKVARLAELCRRNGIWLGLDSWERAHMFGHTNVIPAADEERECARYARIWTKALKLMREDGVLERAVWVAPLNEVPHYGSRFLASVREVHRRALDEGETRLAREEKEDAIYRRINQWIGAPIKDEINRERIPLSYSSLGAERYANRLTDIYDVVDVHFMPPVITDKDDDAAFERATRGAKGPIRWAEFERADLKEFSRVWDRTCRKHYPEMLKRVRDYHETALRNVTLPSGKRLAAVITESFGPCFWPDHPDVNWDWYKRYNGDALRIVSTMDFQGSSLSNYGEPLFSLWNDVDWQWTSNIYFLGAAS
jgi:hypothetical protein